MSLILDAGPSSGELTAVSRRAVLFVDIEQVATDYLHEALVEVSFQRRIGHAVAARLDATIVREYLDTDGTLPAVSRSVLLHLLRDLPNLRPQYLITADPGRLVSNHDDWLALGRTCAACGTAVVRASDQLGPAEAARASEAVTRWLATAQIQEVPTR